MGFVKLLWPVNLMGYVLASWTVLEKVAATMAVAGHVVLATGNRMSAETENVSVLRTAQGKPVGHQTDAGGFVALALIEFVQTAKKAVAAGILASLAQKNVIGGCPKRRRENDVNFK